MTNRSDKLISISFFVNDKQYQAKVYLNRPTAIVIPDQKILAYTSIGPKRDSSSRKARYSKVIEPSDQLEEKIERKQFKARSRTIFNRENKLNEMKIVERSENEPFVCNCRNVILATRLLTNPK